MTQYFCYICQSQCNIINRPDGEVQCTRCQDTFVEEMPEIQADVATGSRGVNPPPSVADENPFGMFPGSPFAPLFNQNRRQHRPQQPPPASPAFQNHPQNPMMADPMANIMHQILAGFIGQAASGHPGDGAQLTIRFMAPGGEGGEADGGFRIHGNMGDYAWGAEGLDNILTALLNQFTDGQPARTLSQEEISRLPMTNVSQAHVDNGTQCTTCMETFGLDEPVAELNCKHIFHRDCIVPWLSRNNTCPICRTEIDPTKWTTSDSSKDTSSSTIADYDELD